MPEVEELIRNLRSPYLDRKWIEEAADRLETLTKALTVSPEKLEAAAKAISGAPFASVTAIRKARAAAIALGMRVNE